MSATYTIKPLYYGRFPAYEKSVCLMMNGAGQKIDNPSIGFLIQGNGKNILVDTGPGSQSKMQPLHPLIVIDFPEDNVVKALDKVGLKPEDIDAVIWTHLHWDHCWNAELFRKDINFYVQASELDYAIHPLPMHGNVYESPACGMTPPWVQVLDRIKCVDGDVEFMDGIQLLLTPGHTPGGQSVLVNTTKGPYCIAGDTVMLYENWDRHIYSTAHVNLLDFEASMQKLAKLNAFILPGHDYKVFDHEVYPVEE